MLLTLIALVVRFYRLETSVRMMIDEIHFAFGSTYFWTFPDVNLLEPMPTSASFPFIFRMANAARCSCSGGHFFGLRAFSAILGALTIPATYGLARELFDRRTAILAALVLLTFPPHVHYSRLALNNIADPLFGTLVAVFPGAGAAHPSPPGLRAGRGDARRDAVFLRGRADSVPGAGRSRWMGIGLVLWRPRPSLRGLILTALVVRDHRRAGLLYAGWHRIFRCSTASTKPISTSITGNAGARRMTVQARIARFEHSLLHYVNSPENTLFHFYLYYGGRSPAAAGLRDPAVFAWAW